MATVRSIIYSVLLSLILFQIMLLCKESLRGIQKYFLLKELDVLARYGGPGSWVVITGASSGQGYDLALAFAKRGFNLLLLGSKRTDETAAVIQKEYPTVKTKVIHKDFRQAFQDDFFVDIQAAFDEIGTDLAVLVNNVGHRVGWKPYHEMNAAYIRNSIATGTIVQSRLTHMAIPFFLKRKAQALEEAQTQVLEEASLKNKTSALVNITAQCMHPNFLFGVTMTNEISVPYLSVYEGANAFGFYHGNSIYHEYKDQFDILNITPGAVITKNTTCLTETMFNIPSEQFVENIMKMLGQVHESHTCAYWGHALSNYLINLAPIMKYPTLKKVGETIAADFMQKAEKETEKEKYDIK